MCGRFFLDSEPEVWERLFGVSFPPHLLARHPEASPSQMLPTILNVASDQVAMLRWGLIPSWAKDPKIGNKIINARAETLLEKPSFRTIFHTHRCLILANGFYEWKKEGGRKTKMAIRPAHRQPFAFAGLWDEWKAHDGNLVRTFTIITTQATGAVAPIHDRMPIMLGPEHKALWLGSTSPATELVSLLSPIGQNFIVEEAEKRQNKSDSSSLWDDLE